MGVTSACSLLQTIILGHVLPEVLPSDDFQSQVEQPLLHHFGFGSLLLVAVYFCLYLLTINTQVKVLKLNPLTLQQESRYHTQDFAERVSVLQHEWIRSALYILVKHNHKFMEGLGEYATVQGNRVLRATNQSGERIFSIVNRILSSHSDVRVPIISGIVKIRALGESLFKQLHNQYASPET